MSTKLEILNQVMHSYTSDRNEVMNDINALLSNREREVLLISNLKSKIENLSKIHDAMRETEAFIMQLTAEEAIMNQVGSGGKVDDSDETTSEK